MRTVKRIINGDRVITVHERVRLGDRMSRVYKEALKVVNGEDNELCFDNAIDLPRKPKPVSYTALTDMSVEQQKSALANLHPFLHNVSNWTVVIGGRTISEAGSYKKLRAHETRGKLVCRLFPKKKNIKRHTKDQGINKVQKDSNKSILKQKLLVSL